MANSARFPVGTAAAATNGSAFAERCRGRVAFPAGIPICHRRKPFSNGGLGAMPEPLTSEAQGLFTLLRQAADPETVAAIEEFVAEAADRELCRINLPAFASRRHLDEERVIGALDRKSGV